jgi:soluble lytic murein transglycosylase-like protein
VKPRTLLLGAGVIVVLVAYQHAETAAQGAAAAGGNLRPGSVPAAYAGIISDAGRTCPQVTAALLAAQINQESGFDPRAVSETNAQGIAQFEPDTAGSKGVDPWDPDSAIHGMARLDCRYVQKFGSVELALAAYNGGPGIVGYWQRVDQTSNYVRSILAAVPHYTADSPAPVPSPNGPGTGGGGEGIVQQVWDALRSAAAGSTS